MNPDITLEQIAARTANVNGVKLLKNQVSAYDIVNNINVKIDKSIFDEMKNIQYVGINSKQNPNRKKKILLKLYFTKVK